MSLSVKSDRAGRLAPVSYAFYVERWAGESVLIDVCLYADAGKARKLRQHYSLRGAIKGGHLSGSGGTAR